SPEHIIPVGIDTALFGTATADRDIDIAGAGNLIALKQYDVFLEVVRSLKEFYPDIKTVICGDGPEMRRLRLMISETGLENNVTLKGRMTHAEVLLLMQRSKIFLHPSAYEGFGAVCLEALYAGAQVVSFVKPMETAISNWHIAANKTDAVLLLKKILQGSATEYRSVLPYPIKDNARKMLEIFGQSDPAIP
ncbi:MAG TPA: glycosyltransferase, partial [Pedobacter sp.]